MAAIFSALDDLAGAEASTFALEGPFLVTKVSRESKRLGMLGSLLVFLFVSGGGEGRTLGVSSGETQNFPTSDSIE